MSLDRLPEQFEEWVGRARAALSRDIERAKEIVAAANAERSSAQSALSALQAQCKSTQTQLEVAQRELPRIGALVAVGHDIEKAREELRRVKSETADTAKALELLQKQRSDVEAKLGGLGDEVRRLVAARTESETVMANIRSKVNSVTFLPIQHLGDGSVQLGRRLG
jgi:chromosome segregation ATPase